MGALVEPPTHPRTHRRRPAGRVRSRLARRQRPAGRVTMKANTRTTLRCDLSRVKRRGGTTHQARSIIFTTTQPDPTSGSSHNDGVSIKPGAIQHLTGDMYWERTSLTACGLDPF